MIDYDKLKHDDKCFWMDCGFFRGKVDGNGYMLAGRDVFIPYEAQEQSTLYVNGKNAVNALRLWLDGLEERLKENGEWE